MPTCTQREILPTFLAKLSRHNPLRKKKQHTLYYDVFITNFAWATGYDPLFTIDVKQELLTAVNWSRLAY
jgi:hypothetical protein